ncbi:MAG: hypothetical protein CME69_12350 [Halobacteriovorax sp.]|nr:hypothetical protein [Halobacteriovorax sp.]|tara:strand:- start:11 stop:361 length:351 start_codon:yes stop_codon:yes gene_type:complete
MFKIIGYSLTIFFISYYNALGTGHNSLNLKYRTITIYNKTFWCNTVRIDFLEKEGFCNYKKSPAMIILSKVKYSAFKSEEEIQYYFNLNRSVYLSFRDSLLPNIGKNIKKRYTLIK